MGRTGRTPLPRAFDGVVICDLHDVVTADLTTVAVLARLRLEARRQGFEFEVRSAPPGLAALLDLLGLTGVLPVVGVRLEGGPATRTAGTSDRCPGTC